MAEPTPLTQHLETYVDVTRSPTHQDAGLEAVAALVKKDALTLELLVREMEMYLTTTDDVIRARGILLLAEILKRLESKPLDEAIIHTLVGFFTDRLADWRALRGALIGCLTLIRRKSNVGSITVTDAHAVAKSFSDKVHVQSLAQYDRKLCFELLGCLLDCYTEAVKPLGEKLVYDTCEAIDGEKDPECLMLAFHMFEALAQIFPDPCGPLGANASFLFEVLGCYFPLHFTHPKGDDTNIRRDDLSRTLMLAFSSTPLFEPFAIPLLLEKLSASLPIAKVDSLKYLNDCALKYGAERMAKHYEGLWFSLKDAVYTSNGNVMSFSPESLNCTEIQENEILKEALNLLKSLIMLDTTFLTFILDDIDVKTIFGSISSFTIYEQIPQESKQKLYAISRILSVSAKASTSSCNRVFEMFFLRLMDILGISARSVSFEYSPKEDSSVSYRNQDGALYFCSELLAASRDLLESKRTPLASDYSHETWCSVLKIFSPLLTQVFTSAVTHNNDTRDVDIYLGVKGLQILGTFPGGYSLVSKAAFENILSTFINIITTHSERTPAWKLALKALVHIGSYIQCQETGKVPSFMNIVVDRVVQLASPEQLDIVYPLRLEVIFEICNCGSEYMLKIVQALEKALCASLSQTFVLETSEAIVNVLQLLQCFCNHLLPRISETGGFEEILVQFAVGIWNQIETCTTFNCQVHEKLVEAVMMSMKLAVGICSIENQNTIIRKAFDVVLSSSLQLSDSERLTPVALENLQLDKMGSRDEWILSLFASVIMAVSPQAHIPNLRSVLQLFLINFLRGHVASAQALGSIVNKLGPVSNGSKVSSDCSLEEAIAIIFHSAFGVDKNLNADRYFGIDSRSDIDIKRLCSGGFIGLIHQVRAITGLAWIGKGLLMRGHERIKDITMVLLECLTANSKTTLVPHGAPDNDPEQIDRHEVMICAADAFQILMCDSDVCLNRNFHAVMRPLYKQRYFSTAVPILESLILEPNSSSSRPMLYRAFTRIVTDTPMMVILENSKRLIPLMLESLSILSDDLEKDMLLSLLLVLSGILTNEKGQEVAIENAHTIINCLVKLTSYPHSMLVRETATQCLIAMSGMPYRRIYPLRTEVLRAISKALNDPKRDVRREAIRCRRAWESIA